MHWRRWLRGPKHGLPRGVAVYASTGPAPGPERLDELLGRCPALRGWARGRGVTLSGVPEDLELLDQAIEDRDQQAQIVALANEAGMFLGTVIVASAAGARWRVWPNGHPVVLLASGRELDVVALAADRCSRGEPWLADACADAVAGLRP
jgi:hypothetical protein